MAQLGKLLWTVLDSSGEPVSGASVAVRKQGATVNGAHAGATTSFTVNDPGGITTSSENVVVGTGTTTRSVASIGATNVTTGAPGFPDLADDDRLSPTTNTPTLYNDATGTESTGSSTLTTNSNGLATAWLRGGSYDIHVSAAGITTVLYIDEPIVAEDTASNVFTTGSQDAFILDTSRALASGDALLSIRENGTQRVWIAQDGKLTVVAGGLVVTAGGLTITAGGLTLSASSITTPSITASGSGSAIIASTGNILATSGNVQTARYFGGNGTQIVAGDIALGGNWGTTPSKGVADTSYDSRGAIQITSGSGAPGANPSFTVTFADGTYTTTTIVLVSRGDANAPDTATWSVTADTATSFTVTFIGTPAASTAYICRYVVIG